MKTFSKEFNMMNNIQKVVLLSRIINITCSQLVFTGILVDLTMIGVITNTTQSIANLLPSLSYVVLRPIYERYKKPIRIHIRFIWAIDMIMSIIGSVMLLFTNNSTNILRIGWILLYIVVEASTTPIIEYCVTDMLFEEIFDQKLVAIYGKMNTQLGNAGSIMAYIGSILVAPILPAFVKFVFMILGTCGTGIGYAFYVIPKLDEKKK